MNESILEIRINELCEKLRESGKNDPASYFEKLLNQIKTSINEVDRQSALQQIISSGKIADMAGFNFEEDQLFDIVYEEAKKIKS